MWTEYLLHTVGLGDTGETQTVVNKALQAVGNHGSDGDMIWQAVFMIEKQVSIGSKINVTLKGCQIVRKVSVSMRTIGQQNKCYPQRCQIVRKVQLTTARVTWLFFFFFFFEVTWYGMNYDFMKFKLTSRLWCAFHWMLLLQKINSCLRNYDFNIKLEKNTSIFS